MRPSLLSLRGVRKGHRLGGRVELVLEDLALDVGAGEVVAVVGQRWEGKTTLLRLAAGIELAEEGRVRFDGTDFASRSRRGRARLLGREILWLDRQDACVGLRVLDFLALPLTMGPGPRRAEARRMAADALERVGAGHLAQKRPQALSSWERVLAGLAGAALVRPKLLVVDDLLDALGTRRTFQAGDLLASLAGEVGFGVLFSLSDIESAAMADRVLVFEQRGLRVMSDQTGATTDALAIVRAQRQQRSRSTRAC